MTGLDEVVWFGARACLVAMFPFSAMDKIWHWKDALAQTASEPVSEFGSRVVGRERRCDSAVRG